MENNGNCINSRENHSKGKIFELLVCFKVKQVIRVGRLRIPEMRPPPIMPLLRVVFK